MRRDTKNWIESSAYDLETAHQMFKTGRYLYVVFMCHLALEKILKAYLTEKTQSIPAKTHDLLYLVSKSKIELLPDHLDFVGKINNASIPTRYPDDIRRMLKDYTKGTAQNYTKMTKSIIKWIKDQIK